MLVIVSVAVPLFVSVTACAALVVPMLWPTKVRLVGDTLAVVPVPLPVPVRLTVCGLPVALSVIVRVPLLVPEAVGVNVTLIVQLDPADTADPQLFVCPKSPLVEMRLTLRNAVPVLLNVTVWAPLVVPTVWLAKVSVVGETLVVDASVILAAKASCRPPP